MARLHPTPSLKRFEKFASARGNVRPVSDPRFPVTRSRWEEPVGGAGGWKEAGGGGAGG